MPFSRGGYGGGEAIIEHISFDIFILRENHANLNHSDRDCFRSITKIRMTTVNNGKRMGNFKKAIQLEPFGYQHYPYYWTRMNLDDYIIYKLEETLFVRGYINSSPIGARMYKELDTLKPVDAQICSSIARPEVRYPCNKKLKLLRNKLRSRLSKTFDELLADFRLIDLRKQIQEFDLSKLRPLSKARGLVEVKECTCDIQCCYECDCTCSFSEVSSSEKCSDSMICDYSTKEHVKNSHWCKFCQHCYNNVLCDIRSLRPDHEYDSLTDDEYSDWTYDTDSDLESYEVQNQEMGVQSMIEDKISEALQQMGSIFSRYSIDKTMIGWIENGTILAYSLATSTSRGQMLIALVNFYKSITKSNVMESSFMQSAIRYITKLFGGSYKVQGLSSDVRNCLVNYKKFSKSTLFQKVQKMYFYCLSYAMFESFGLSFKTQGYTQMEEEMIKRKHSGYPDMIYDVMDSVLYVIETIERYYKNGQASELLFGFTDAEAWVDRCYDLDLKSKYLQNPEAVDFNLYKYLADLKLAIEQGESLLKYDVSIDKTVIKKLVHSLRRIDLDYKSSKYVQRSRKAPFTVLVEGTTSVGKSGFQKILMYHYGKIFGLPTEDQFSYTRIFQDEFWAGFATYMWCLILDDVGFMLGEKQPNGDQSLSEVIQIDNNVSFCPPQAALEDKGKVPFLGKIMIGSTNTLGLGVEEHFRCPLAHMRRWKLAVRIKPKEEYADTRGFLDPSKLPASSNQRYDNFWDITCCRAVPVKDGRSSRGKFVPFAKFDNINDFLVLFSKMAKEHDLIQEKVIAGNQDKKDVEVCMDCYYPKIACKCKVIEVEEEMKAQTHEEIFPEIVLNDPETSYQIAREIDPNTKCDEEISTPVVQTSDEEIAFNITLANFWNDGWFAPMNSFWTTIFLYLSAWFSAKWYFRYIVGADVRLWIFPFAYFIYSCLWETYYPSIYTTICYFACGIYFKTWRTYGYKWFAKRCVRQMCSNIQITYKNNKCLTNICLALSMFLFSYKIYRRSDYKTQRDILDLDSQDMDIELKDIDDGVAYKNKVKEEQSVWYKDDFHISVCDLTETILSKPDEKTVLSAIARNSYIIQNVFVNDRGVPRIKTNRMLGLRGNLYVTNKHGVHIREDGSIKMTISQKEDDGVTPRNTVVICAEDIFNPKNTDLLYLNIKGRPPVRDITRLFPLHTLNSILRGKYVIRELDGTISTLPVEKILKKKLYVEEVDSDAELWVGVVETDTKLGECGSPLVATTEHGNFIVGIHLLGGANKTGAIKISLEDILIAEQKIMRYTTEEGYINISAPGYARHLGDLSRKSVFRYLQEGEAKIFGTFEEFRTKPKSMVRPSIIVEELEAQGMQQKWTAPVMHGWRPWRQAVEPIVKPKKEFDHEILNMSVQDYETQIREMVSKEDFEQLREVDWDTAINGASGVRFIDKMNRNTSMGAPFRKSKRHFITPIEGDTDRVEFDEVVMGRCKLIVSKYSSGQQFHPVYTGSLKDEGVTFEKARIAKTRMFAAAPGDWCTVVRKYLISFIRLFQTNVFAFEGMVGVNCHSKDWGEIYKYLTKFGTKRMIAGDFKAFDKGMFAEFILAAFQIIRNLHVGYVDPTHLHKIDMIALDIAYPIVDINGDLVQFFGFNPSGQPLTVIINCIVHSLYIRYCFFSYLKRNGLTILKFRLYVALATYGDDGAMGVSEKIPWFTHTFLVLEFEAIGIGYTMADKEATSIPYIDMFEVSFLKRIWKFDERFNDYVAPLDINSVNKSLMINVVSRSIPRQEQTINIIRSAMHEVFYHGEEMFLKYEKMLKDICKRDDLAPYVDDSTFPDYQMLIDSFNNAKPALKYVAMA